MHTFIFAPAHTRSCPELPRSADWVVLLVLLRAISLIPFPIWVGVSASGHHLGGGGGGAKGAIASNTLEDSGFLFKNDGKCDIFLLKQ